MSYSWNFFYRGIHRAGKKGHKKFKLQSTNLAAYDQFSLTLSPQVYRAIVLLLVLV